MKSFSFYHKDTRLFDGRHYMTSVEQHVALYTPPDHVAIAGHHDHLSKRVDISTGEVVDHQPSQPTENHVWDDVTKRWVIEPGYKVKLAAHRDALAKIEMLEASQPRYIREHTLGTNPKALERLHAIEDEIVELRKAVMQELCAS